MSLHDDRKRQKKILFNFVLYMEIFNWKQIISKHKLFFFFKGRSVPLPLFKTVPYMFHTCNYGTWNQCLNQIIQTNFLITIMKSNKQTTTATFKKFNVENILHILHTNFFKLKQNNYSNQKQINSDIND